MKGFKDFLKISAKLLLLLPIFAFMVFCNYKIDPSGLFFGKGFERVASEYMLSGYAIDGYERLDGRLLNEVYAKNVPYAPQVLINGSSRSMSITADIICPGKTFYNAGNVGADRYDFFTSYYIFAKENKEPEIMVLSLDAWLFSDNEMTIDHRSDKELYCEFVTEELGLEGYEYTQEEEVNVYEALFAPNYFQAAIAYYNRDTSGEVAPEIVEGDWHSQNEVIKCPDGSIIYDQAFANRSDAEMDQALHNEAHANEFLGNMKDFNSLDPEFTSQLELFIEYLQKKDIKVVLYIPPYQEYFYDVAVARADKHPGFFMIEDYVDTIAKKYGLEVYGGLDAAELGLGYRDFWDSYHIKPENISKFFPALS